MTLGLSGKYNPRKQEMLDAEVVATAWSPCIMVMMSVPAWIEGMYRPAVYRAARGEHSHHAHLRSGASSLTRPAMPSTSASCRRTAARECCALSLPPTAPAADSLPSLPPGWGAASPACPFASSADRTPFCESFCGAGSSPGAASCRGPPEEPSSRALTAPLPESGGSGSSLRDCAREEGDAGGDGAGCVARAECRMLPTACTAAPTSPGLLLWAAAGACGLLGGGVAAPEGGRAWAWYMAARRRAGSRASGLEC